MIYNYIIDRPQGPRALLVIEANPSITESEIGRLLTIKRANMAPLAALLTSRGLVLTPKGRAEAGG